MINVIEKTAIVRRPNAGLMRRLASMVYECLLLAAVLFIAAFVFIAFARTPPQTLLRGIFQLYLIAVSATYLIWFWLHGGQTLAMKTWAIRLETRTGEALRLPRALARFVLALIGVSALGIGLVWALLDRERLFLHDRIAATRLVDVRVAGRD